MFRYNFVPLEEPKTAPGHCHRQSQPADDDRRDQPAAGQAYRHQVATYAQISEILKKTEQSKRVLEEASEGFTLAVVFRRRGGREDMHLDRPADAQGDNSQLSAWWIPRSLPALQRRASDITSRRATTRCASSSALTACWTQAMPPIGKEHQSTIISRIKVMSELDISERVSRRTAASG